MITVVDYKLNNLRSIENTLRRLGHEVIVTSNPEDVRNATKLILPGVGAFRDAMRNLNQLGLVDSSGQFTGAHAVAAYGGLIPLEDSGGSGTAGSHWDETNFKPNGVQMSNELMTGYFVPGEQTYLSDTTVGALADLGYTVQDPSIVGTSLLVDSQMLMA